MVVKSVRGRRRYVYLRVPVQMRRDDISLLLSDVPSVKVITCHAGDAVVRCSPEERDAMIGILAGEGCESVSCSGTLRTLRTEYPQLRVPQKRRR